MKWEELQMTNVIHLTWTDKLKIPYKECQPFVKEFFEKIIDIRNSYNIRGGDFITLAGVLTRDIMQGFSDGHILMNIATQQEANEIILNILSKNILELEKSKNG